MPTYDYTCPDCGGRLSVTCRMSERRETLDCRCGGKMLQTFHRPPGVKVEGGTPTFHGGEG